MNLLFRPTRPAEPVEPVVDVAAMKRLSVELTAALDRVTGWERRDGESFVAAGRTDGTATIVGNSGGWRLVRCGPGDKPMSEPVPSARDALAAAPKHAAQ